jgi:imidazolonepropionase-like amidohydrolase
MLADRGTYLVVTYGITELACEDPAVPDYYREKISATLATYKEVIREACQRGVKVAIGGDGVHGRPALELRALIRGGFTPLQALQAATRNGADLLGISHQIGTVEPGKRADLVAIEGDITADIMDLEKVRYVMRDGREQFPRFSWPEYNLQYVF